MNGTRKYVFHRLCKANFAIEYDFLDTFIILANVTSFSKRLALINVLLLKYPLKFLKGIIYMRD